LCFERVGLVLLIARANVANLQLARAAAAGGEEIAVRTALGAGRARMLGQLLTESLLLACAGGAAGLLAALWTVQLMNRTLPQGLLPVPEVAVDTTVLLFALGITLATGILFGFAPAWNAARGDLNMVLKQGGRGALSGQRTWVRHTLVAANWHSHCPAHRRGSVGPEPLPPSASATRLPARSPADLPVSACTRAVPRSGPSVGAISRNVTVDRGTARCARCFDLQRNSAGRW
jgi:hypothetical protein